LLAILAWRSPRRPRRVLRLANGEEVRGEVVEETPAAVTIAVAGGRVRIARASIVEIVRETPAQYGPRASATVERALVERAEPSSRRPSRARTAPASRARSRRSTRARSARAARDGDRHRGGGLLDDLAAHFLAFASLSTSPRAGAGERQGEDREQVRRCVIFSRMIGIAIMKATGCERWRRKGIWKDGRSLAVVARRSFGTRSSSSRGRPWKRARAGRRGVHGARAGVGHARRARGAALAVEECRAGDFDAILVVGGMGRPRALWIGAAARAVRDFYAQGRSSRRICLSGPVLANGRPRGKAGTVFRRTARSRRSRRGRGGTERARRARRQRHHGRGAHAARISRAIGESGEGGRYEG